MYKSDMSMSLKSCKFNMDTNCVDLSYADGSNLSISCEAVEDEFAANLYQQSELDYLIYNKPLEYARLVLSGNLCEYLHNYTDQRPIDERE